MYVQYGNYRHPDDEAGITYDERFIQNQRGNRFLNVRSIAVIGKLLNKTGIEDDMGTRIDRLKDAYAVNGRDLGLYHSDGSRTPIFLDSSESISGVRIVGQSFPTSQIVYSTNYDFRVVAEATFADPHADGLLEYSETLVYIGNGGPRRVGIELELHIPQIQITRQRTLCRAIQSGRAVGLLGYPLTPQPYFPALLQNPDTAISLTTPTRNGNGFMAYEVTWNYQFLSPVPFPLRAPTPR